MVAIPEEVTPEVGIPEEATRGEGEVIRGEAAIRAVDDSNRRRNRAKPREQLQPMT